MNTVELLLLIVAVIFFGLATVGVQAGRVHLGWCALTLVALVWLLRLAAVAGYIHGG